MHFKRSRSQWVFSACLCAQNVAEYAEQKKPRLTNYKHNLLWEYIFSVELCRQYLLEFLLRTESTAAAKVKAMKLDLVNGSPWLCACMNAMGKSLYWRYVPEIHVCVDRWHASLIAVHNPQIRQRTGKASGRLNHSSIRASFPLAHSLSGLGSILTVLYVFSAFVWAAPLL